MAGPGHSGPGRWTTPRLHSTRRAAAARLSLARYMATFRANDTLIDRRHGPCLAHRSADPVRRSAPEGFRASSARRQLPVNEDGNKRLLTAPRHHSGPPQLSASCFTSRSVRRTGEARWRRSQATRAACAARRAADTRTANVDVRGSLNHALTSFSMLSTPGLHW